MGFNAEVAARVAFRANYECEICGEDLYEPDPKKVVRYVIHSGTSLHLIGGPERYLVSQPPKGFERLKGTYIRGELYRDALIGRPDDGFCLCPTCHRNVHIIAVNETKSLIENHKGKMAIPNMLLEVTLYCKAIKSSSW